MSYMKHTKKRKQTLERAQYELEIIFNPVEFEIAGFSFSCGRNLKKKLFENDDVTIIT